MTFVQKCVTSWNQAFLVSGMRTHAYLRQIAHKHICRKSQPIIKKVTSFRKLHSNELACVESSSSELHGCHWSTCLSSNSTRALFIMINTFHSSYNLPPVPPPVPPRAGYRKPQAAGNTSLVKFLSVMLLLLMIVTFGGFLYLFQKLNMVWTLHLLAALGAQLCINCRFHGCTIEIKLCDI